MYSIMLYLKDNYILKSVSLGIRKGIWKPLGNLIILLKVAGNLNLIMPSEGETTEELELLMWVGICTITLESLLSSDVKHSHTCAVI